MSLRQTEIKQYSFHMCFLLFLFFFPSLPFKQIHRILLMHQVLLNSVVEVVLLSPAPPPNNIQCPLLEPSDPKKQKQKQKQQFQRFGLIEFLRLLNDGGVHSLGLHTISFLDGREATYLAIPSVELYMTSD